MSNDIGNWYLIDLLDLYFVVCWHKSRAINSRCQGFVVQCCTRTHKLVVSPLAGSGNTPNAGGARWGISQFFSTGEFWTANATFARWKCKPEIVTDYVCF